MLVLSPYKKQEKSALHKNYVQNFEDKIPKFWINVNYFKQQERAEMNQNLVFLLRTASFVLQNPLWDTSAGAKLKE